MINNLLPLLTLENIYLIANWGIIPFWILLIIFPYHQLTNFFVQSIVIPLLLAIGYAYLSYKIYLDGNIGVFSSFLPSNIIIIACSRTKIHIRYR